MLEVCGLQAEREERILFSDLAFDLKPGSMLLVTGPNGSGKSTLLKMLAGLLPISTGNITWEERVNNNFLYIGHKTGLLPALTPVENLKWLLELQAEMQTEAQTKTQTKTQTKAQISKQRIIFALEELGLKGFENTSCEALSFGQRQRVALARLWITSQKVWILDEPFTGLDAKTQSTLSNRFLEHLNVEGIIIVASHSTMAESFNSYMQTITF